MSLLYGGENGISSKKPFKNDKSYSSFLNILANWNIEKLIFRAASMYIASIIPEDNSSKLLAAALTSIGIDVIGILYLKMNATESNKPDENNNQDLSENDEQVILIKEMDGFFRLQIEGTDHFIGPHIETIGSATKFRNYIYKKMGDSKLKLLQAWYMHDMKNSHFKNLYKEWEDYGDRH